MDPSTIVGGANLSDMEFISKFNKGFRFLLCVIDIFSKYAWVVALEDKKCVTIVNAFQKILDKATELHSGRRQCQSKWRKPTKIWVDKGIEFYNSSFKKWLKDNDIEMYSIHSEGKSVVAERFIKTLKTKIYKYMTSASTNVYINKLDDIVNEYKNTYHRAIKMKPVYVIDNKYVDFGKEVNDKGPKFKVGDHVRISKCKNIFAKGYTPNRSEEVFVIKTVTNTVPWRYFVSDLSGEEIIESFYEKELQKTN